MIVTTSGFGKRKTLAPFLNALTTRGVMAAVFDEVVPNPDFACIEKAAAFYRSRGCDAIVAIGGGSVLSCAKIAGALVARPGKCARDLVGSMKVRAQLPLLVAVPTTAGTGSEVTATALVVNPDMQRSCVVRDEALIPDVAVLDSTLLTSLPSEQSASAGMDALTQAVEAYINFFGFPGARSDAIQSVKAIFEHLKPSCDDGKNIEHREALIWASHWAGIASSNALAGYTQALANGICGRYGVSRGLACSALLPVVLEEYGDVVWGSLSDLARALGFEGASERDLAESFIGSIRALSASVGLPSTIAEMREEDIPALAVGAEEEANPSYPVPETWHYSTLQKVLRRAMGKAADEERSSAIQRSDQTLDDEVDARLEHADSAFASNQVRITKPGPLLDETGRLASFGYATSLLLDYDRKRVKATPLRIKEWDYYLVYDEDYALALTIGDMGYAALVSASIVDFTRETFVTQSTMDLLPLGKLGLPRSSASGVTAYADKRVEMRFEVAGGMRLLKVVFGDFSEGSTLEAEVVLDNEPRDSMVIATPWAEDSHAFYYNQKIVGMRAIGTLRLGDLHHVFNVESAFGLLDWGRGVWTRDNTWYWSAAQGMQNGHIVGFNLGYGFGDTFCASENMVFVDGIAHKLGRVDFGIPVRNERAKTVADRFDLAGTWHMTDDEGRMDLVFTPQVDRCDHMDFKVVVSDQHQVFGLFDGWFILDSGEKIEVRGLRGFAEAVHNVY